MITNRLYYADPYLRTFDATVLAIERRPGKTTAVYLDRTAFYPTSGGQPFDVGTLAGLRVIEVADEEGGAIAHIVEEAKVPFGSGEVVQGTIDWGRRFDHMQQHTGQHVLSAAFDHLFHVRTVSFHLGAQVSTIDLAREMTATNITAAETEVNRVVWEDRPVTIRFVTSDQAAELPLRKESKREGTLRLIDIEGFDLSACGGTHVARTGAIGMVAVTSWERFKGGQRLEFLCGGRALERLRAWRSALAASTRLLSVLPGELPSAIERLQAEGKEQMRSMLTLENELSRYKAAELAAAAEVTPAGRLVVRDVDAGAGRLKAMAAAVTAKPGHIAVLASTSTPVLVVVARSADITISAERILARLISAFGGRGGGKPELAQGGGLIGPVDAILAAAREAIVST